MTDPNKKKTPIDNRFSALTPKTPNKLVNRPSASFTNPVPTSCRESVRPITPSALTIKEPLQIQAPFPPLFPQTKQTVPGEWFTKKKTFFILELETNDDSLE